MKLCYLAAKDSIQLITWPIDNFNEFRYWFA
jgi:hypothetical protein